MRSIYLVLGLILTLILSGCQTKETAVESIMDSKAKGACEQKEKDCYELALSQIESDLKSLKKNSIPTGFKETNTYNEFVQTSMEAVQAANEKYITTIQDKETLDSKTASYIHEALQSKGENSLITLLKKWYGVKVEGEAENQIKKEMTQLLEDTYQLFSVYFYNSVSNKFEPKFDEKIKELSAKIETTQSTISDLEEGKGVTNTETNEETSKSQEEDNKTTSSTNSKSSSEKKSQVSIQGKVITGNFNPSYSFDIRSTEGIQYKIHLISDNEKKYIQDMTWAGAQQGDQMREGHYKIALQQGGGKPYLQEVSAGDWIFNDSSGAVIVHSGSPDILALRQREASVIDTGAGFYVHKGKVMALKNKEGQQGYAMSFGGFKNLSNGQFMIVDYNNAEGFWAFLTLEFDFDTGIYKTINERIINNIDEGNAYFQSNFK